MIRVYRPREIDIFNFKCISKPFDSIFWISGILWRKKRPAQVLYSNLFAFLMNGLFIFNYLHGAWFFLTSNSCVRLVVTWFGMFKESTFVSL